MTTREQIMRLIVNLISAAVPDGVLVVRNADIPLDMPHSGYVVIRDSAPVVEDSTLGNSKIYFMRLDVPIEVYASGSTEEDRSEFLDELCSSVSLSLYGSNGIGSIAQYVETSISEIEAIFVEGAATRSAAQITASIEYDSLSSIG